MGCNQCVMCQLWLFESYFHISVSRLYVCVSFVVPFQLRRWFQLVLAPGFYEKIKRAVFLPFPVPKKEGNKGMGKTWFYKLLCHRFSAFWENLCVDELGSAIWWPAGESEDKPLMAADKSLPASCTERNLLWKKGWAWYRPARLGKKVTVQTFLVKKQLYNPQKESIYWKLSSFLIACVHWASFFASTGGYWGWWMWLCLFSE